MAQHHPTHGEEANAVDWADLTVLKMRLAPVQREGLTFFAPLVPKIAPTFAYREKHMNSCQNTPECESY